MITLPTISEIKQQILADLQGADTSTPLGLVSIMEIMAGAYAVVLYLCYKFGYWAYQQIFTATMDEDSLVVRAAKYDIYKNAAVQCRATATATGTNDAIIDRGTLLEKDGQTYSVDSDTTISGATSVSITAILSGEDSQLTVGDELSLVTPKTGVDNLFTIGSVLTDGEDEQTTDSLKNQVTQREKNKPQGGAIPDFVGWALENSGVGEAFAFRPTPGYVNVFILTDEDDPADREPSEALRTTVSDYINDPEILPFGRDVSVPAWSVLTFDLDFGNLSPNNTTTETAIEEAVTDYFYERRPKQYPDQPEDLSNISAAELYDVAVAAGATNLTITLKNSSGSDITDSGYTLEDGEICEVGAMTWT